MFALFSVFFDETFHLEFESKQKFIRNGVTLIETQALKAKNAEVQQHQLNDNLQIP